MDDPDKFLNGTVEEVKNKVRKRNNLDYNKLLRVEKANQDRDSMINFLQHQKNETQDDISAEPVKEEKNIDYRNLSDKTVKKIKSEVEENHDIDLLKLLEAEKVNQDREVLLNWIRNRIRGEEEDKEEKQIENSYERFESKMKDTIQNIKNPQDKIEQINDEVKDKVGSKGRTVKRKNQEKADPVEKTKTPKEDENHDSKAGVEEEDVSVPNKSREPRDSIPEKKAKEKLKKDSEEDYEEFEKRIEQHGQNFNKIRDMLQKVIVGQEEPVEKVLIALMCDGNWHHICAVFDSSVTNEKKIYVDGQLDAEADQFSTGTGFGTADGSEAETYGFIGTGSEASNFDGARGPGQYLEGKIDSLQVFNRSLSQSEIQELAVSNPPRKGSNIRDFNVPGYQEPAILEATNSGLGADTEFRLSGSNQNGEELFIDSSSGSKNFSLSLGQDNKFSLNVNGSTSNKLKSPIMNSLTIWMDSKMYSSTVSAVNEAGNVKDNAEVSFFNRFDDILSEAQLSSSQTDTEERIPRMENYSVKVDAPTGYSFQEVRVNQIESDADKNLDFQMISNYSGTSIPDTATDRYNSDPVIAFDDSSTNYEDAELVLPYTNSAVDKIAHCTDWDFTNRECSSSTDWDLNDPSFYNAELNGTHAIFSVSNFDAYATVKESQKFPNLKVNEVTLNDTEPVSGNSVEITANISNNESVSASPKINLSVISYNGTDWIYEQNQSTNVNVGGNSFELVDFVISSKPGRYRFKVTADPDDSIGETSESDNSNFTELNFSSHQLFYGSTSESVNLADEQDKTIQSWVSDEANGTLYFTDSDVSFAVSDLMPLNESGDLGEADQALNLTGHNDSLSNLFDSNGDGSADETGCLLVSGSSLCDVPLINSTNSSSFRTGVLYDSSDGSPYDGSQNLIFATEINSSKTGKYGTYDYEIRIPYTLERQEPAKDTISVFRELN